MQETMTIHQLFTKLHGQIGDAKEWFILVCKDNILLTVDDEKKLYNFIEQYLSTDKKTD